MKYSIVFLVKFFRRIINKLIVTIFSIIFLSSALWSEEVVIKDDPFTKSKVVTLDTWHKVKEGNLDNTRIVYEKEIKNGKESAPVARFEFKITVNPMTSYAGEDLDPFAYVLIGDESFKVSLTDRSKTLQEQIYGSSSRAFGADIQNYHIAYLKCTIIFTQEMISKIANADKLKIRVSTNNNATVMEATSKQLNLVKKFFASKGEVEKPKPIEQDTGMGF